MSSLIKLTRTIHFLEQFTIYNACMYLCMYTNIIWLCMIKARIRWCSCRVENILTLGKLLRLWFCFLLHSILFFISQTSYRTYKIISSYKLARPIMGTIFLVNQTPLSIGVNILCSRLNPHSWNRQVLAVYVYVVKSTHCFPSGYRNCVTIYI